MVKKISNCLLICMLLFSILYIPSVSAKTLGELKSELAKYEADYNNNLLQQKLSEQEKANIQNKINGIYKTISQTNSDIVSLNNEIEELKVKIEENEKEIEEILNFTQISNGEPAYLEYAFGASTFTDFIYRVAISEQLTAYNNNLIETQKKNIEDNEKKTEELENTKVKLQKQQEELRVELVKIQSELEELDDQSISIADEIKLMKSTISVYQKLGCKDNEDIKTCGNRLTPSDTGFYRPVKFGAVSGWWNLERTIYLNGRYVFSPHRGVDITSQNANWTDYPIYSTANGVVVGILGIDANGNHSTNTCGIRLFIQHTVNGKTYTSQYGHLRRVNVKVGEIVTKETQVGVMGGYSGTEPWDKCSTGAHVHFEISTGTFTSSSRSAYDAGRVNPVSLVNFPKSTYIYWYDRYSKY